MTRPRLHFVGRGGTSWRDPRNWSRSPNGPSLARLHVRGNEIVVVGDAGELAQLDLRGMPHVAIEVGRFQGVLILPDGTRVDFGRRSRAARLFSRFALRRRFRPRLLRGFEDALARAGGWQKAVRDGLAHLIVTPRGSMIVPVMAGGVSPAYVRENLHNTNQNGATGLSTRAFGITNGATAGNTVIVAFNCDALGSIQSNWSMTDTRGNTYTVDGFIQTAVGCIVIASTHQNAGTIQSGDTLTVTGSASHKFFTWEMRVEEFSGLITSISPVDKTATNSGSGTSAPTGTTAATTQPDEVAFAYCGIDVSGAVTKNAGYTAFTTGVQNITNGLLGTALSGNGCFKILSATGTQSATFTITSANFWSLIVTYKAIEPAFNGPRTPFVRTLPRRSQTQTARQRLVTQSGSSNEFDHGGPYELRFPLIGPWPPTVINPLPSQRMQTPAIYDTAALLTRPLRQKRNLMLGGRTRPVLQSGAATEFGNTNPHRQRFPLIGPWPPAIINPLPSQKQQAIAVYDLAPLIRGNRPRRTAAFYIRPATLQPYSVTLQEDTIRTALVRTRPRPTRRFLSYVRYPQTSSITVRLVRTRPRPTTKVLSSVVYPATSAIRTNLIRTRPRPTVRLIAPPTTLRVFAGPAIYVVKTRPRPTTKFVAPPSTLEPYSVILAEDTIRTVVVRTRPRPTKKFITAVTYPQTSTILAALVRIRPRPTRKFISAVRYPRAGVGFVHLVRTRPRPTTRFVRPPATLEPYSVIIAEDTIRVVLARIRPRPTSKFVRPPTVTLRAPVFFGPATHLVQTRPRHTVGRLAAPIFYPASSTIQVFIVRTRPRPTMWFVAPPATLEPKHVRVSVTDGEVVPTATTDGSISAVGVASGEIVKTAVTDGVIQP